MGLQEETEAAAERKKQQSEKGRKGARLVVEQRKESSQAAAGAVNGGNQGIAATARPKQPKRKRAVAAEAPAPDKPQKAKKEPRTEAAQLDVPGAALTKQQRQSEPLPAREDGSEAQKQNTDAHSKDEQAAAAKQQSRLASFAKPTLAKPDKLKGKKKKETQQPSPAAPGGPQLTKAQRKNLWRQKRRALLKQSLTASL